MEKERVGKIGVEKREVEKEKVEIRKVEKKKYVKIKFIKAKFDEMLKLSIGLITKAISKQNFGYNKGKPTVS